MFVRDNARCNVNYFQAIAQKWFFAMFISRSPSLTISDHFFLFFIYGVEKGSGDMVSTTYVVCVSTPRKLEGDD